MIVTARAADGEAEEGAGRGREHVVHRVVARALDFVGGDLRGENARAEKARGCHRERIARGELVARELPARELVERQVGVQRLDDEVAVMKRVRPVVVVLEAAALGEARHVEPVPRPAFAVGWGVEQLIDHGGERLRRFVARPGLFQKPSHILRRRRQAGEAEKSASQQRARIGGRIECEALGLRRREQKGVHRMRCTRGRCHLGERLKGPPLAVRGAHDRAVARGCWDRDERRVVGRAEVDPRGDFRDRGGGKLRLLLGHSRFQLVTDELEQAARRRVERSDGRSFGAAAQESLARGEVEVVAGLLAAVALHAVLTQQRRDVGAEQLEAARHPRRVVRGQGGGGGGLAAKNAKRRKEENDLSGLHGWRGALSFAMRKSSIFGCFTAGAPG